MNSLEFIDKEIRRIKRVIEVTKNDIEFIKENKRDTAELQVKLAILENHLNSLHQIKTELEAWKSVKKGLKLCEGKVYDDSYYEYLDFEYELFDESESEESYSNLIPIKKALEIKDEKEN